MRVARIWNCFGFPKLELENLSFSNIRKIKSDNNACSNFGLPAAAHPHSCAQPRAQLVEACALQKLETSWGLAACAWRGFGVSSGSQNRNLEIIFFLTFANSKVKTLRVATLAAAAAHPHSYAQPRAQLLGACAWLGLGALWGFPRSEHENNSV